MTSTSFISSAIPALPENVVGNIIFPYLLLPALGVCCRVCKAWNKVAREEMKAFSYENAFGPKEWFIYFGAHLKNVPRLPSNIAKILSAPCSFWPKKKVFETHLLVLVPKTVNGQPLTLKLLEELVKKPIRGNPARYSCLILGNYTDPAAPPSHWVLLTRDVIEGSRNKSYKDQQALLAQCSQKAKVSYEVPKILDATVCIFMEHVRTGVRLYPVSPSTFTLCQEKYDASCQLGVGCFAPGHLSVSHCSGVYEFYGVGGLCKFDELELDLPELSTMDRLAKLFRLHDSPQDPLIDPFVAAAALPQPVLAVQKTEPAQPAAVPATLKAQAAAPVQATKAKLPAGFFGAAEWNKYFGDVGAEPSLPDDIIQRLPELSKNNVLVLIPAAVNGKPLTLKTLGELVQKPLQGHASKYNYFEIGEYTDQPAKSHWALLTRTVIEGSRNKTYKDEQAIVASYSQKTKIVYEIPTVLDAAVCNFMEYVRSGTWLYGENPWTSTWCQEKHDASYYLEVGRGSGFGLSVSYYIDCFAISRPPGVGGLCKVNYIMYFFDPCDDENGLF